MDSLQDIQKTLRAALGTEALFGLISTRVSLRTGIDLTAIAAGEDRNPQSIEKVSEALTALGFPLATLQSVAKTRSK